MKVVVDSNVIFAALIRNGNTRKILLEREEKFLFPEYIFEELRKHKDRLLEESKINEKEFNALFDSIMGKMQIVPTKDTLPFSEEALKIVKDLDLGDGPFFACALAYPKSIIWSNDKRLKVQKTI